MGHEPPDDFVDGLIASVPRLRAFAVSLSRDPEQSEDLVQSTLVRAMERREQFVSGTNQRAWLQTILKSLFLMSLRRRRPEAEDARLLHDRSGATGAQAPEDVVDLRRLARRLDDLPPPQRRAVLLVGVMGLSHEEAAARCDCAVGTVKSRLNRARGTLSQGRGA